ncbi:divalent-cation tolerance protein CutA [candidate division WOR-3 bacterium]|nr:divalent-cation tolerance protein CutA [candidate division WOR-3 bacterium]
MARFVQVSTAFGSRTDALRVGRAVVRQRLAACAQVLGPVFSSYHWNGRQQSTREWLCLLKTTGRAYPALESVLLRLHPYETPEIVAAPVTAGSAAYLTWLAAEVGRTDARLAPRAARKPRR